MNFDQDYGWGFNLQLNLKKNKSSALARRLGILQYCNTLDAAVESIFMIIYGVQCLMCVANRHKEYKNKNTERK